MKSKVCAIIGNTTNRIDLGSLTERRSISTLLYACKYRVIDFPLSSVMNAGVNSVYYVLSEHSFQSFFDHLGSGREWGFDGIKKRYFTYVVHNKESYKSSKYYDCMIDYLEKSGSSETVLLGTEMIANVDIEAVLQRHREENSKITAVYKPVLKESICCENDVLEINEFRVIQNIQSHDASCTDQYHNLCLNDYVIDTEWLIQRLELAKERNEGYSVEQIIELALTEEKDTYAFEHEGYLCNIHDVPSYYQGNMDMLSYPKMRNLLYGTNKIFTKLKNEAPAYYGGKSNVSKSQFGAGCKVDGTVHNSLISRSVTVEEGATVRNSIVLSGTKIGANAEIQYAIIDKNVTIDDGIKISGTLNNPIVIDKGTHVEKDVEGRITA